MGIDVALRTILTGQANTVTALVGAQPNDRVYPVVLRQNSELPAISYFIVSEDRPRSSQQGPLRLVQVRMQIDAWAQSNTAALDLAEKVRIVLDNFRGTVGDVVIQNVSLISGRPFFEQEPETHRMSRDYYIWFEEPIS